MVGGAILALRTMSLMKDAGAKASDAKVRALWCLIERQGVLQLQGALVVLPCYTAEWFGRHGCPPATALP